MPISAQQTTDSYTAAQFLRTYVDLWYQHFPTLNKRAHWQIFHAIAFEGGHAGIEFGEIHKELYSEYRMDVRTAEDRVLECLREGFIRSSSDELCSSTVISPTEKLTVAFGAHYSDGIASLLDCTSPTRSRRSPDRDFFGDNRSMERFYQLLKDQKEEWDKHLKWTLRDNKLSPGHISDAIRHLNTYSYWNITMYVWCNEHERRAGRASEALLADTIYVHLYQKLQIAFATTADRLKDLQRWGILSTLAKRNKNNRKSIVMADTAFRHLDECFSETMRLMRDASEDILEHSPAGGSIVPLSSR